MVLRFLLLALLAFSISSHAQIISAWNLTGSVGDELAINATNSASHIAGLQLTRGAGLGANTTADAFVANGWTGQATDFFSFGFSVNDGYAVNLTNLVIGLRASNRGPGALGLFYNGDSFSSNLFTFTQDHQNVNNAVIDLTALQNLTGNVEFRIATLSNVSANGNTILSNGTLRIQAHAGYPSVQFNGAVAAVPEPNLSAMLLVGLGLVGLSFRRQTQTC